MSPKHGISQSEVHQNAQGSTHHWLLRTVGFVYRYTVSPILHSTQRTLTGSTGACRFQPTCSEYAALAFHLHGPTRGAALALRRIFRCHPFSQGGFDPVPNPRGAGSKPEGAPSSTRAGAPDARSLRVGVRSGAVGLHSPQEWVPHSSRRDEWVADANPVEHPLLNPAQPAEAPGHLS
jgi:putative membrane protein insertion efficiency factor